MVRTINTTELRKSITSWLEWMVGARNRAIVVQSRGQPVAAILTIEEYERYLAFKQSAQFQEVKVQLPTHRPIQLANPRLKNPRDAGRFVMHMEAGA
jgi:hypothetical protein